MHWLAQSVEGINPELTRKRLINVLQTKGSRSVDMLLPFVSDYRVVSLFITQMKVIDAESSGVWWSFSQGKPTSPVCH